MGDNRRKVESFIAAGRHTWSREWVDLGKRVRNYPILLRHRVPNTLAFSGLAAGVHLSAQEGILYLFYIILAIGIAFSMY